MVNADSKAEHLDEIEAALLDAELFVKYKAPERAIKRLRLVLEHNPRSIPARERLREICATHKHPDEAARQCLALASLYIDREDFDGAYDRLLEAKQLDPRINIASGLEAIRSARRPNLRTTSTPEPTTAKSPRATFTGNLASISVFDAIQVIENARLTGLLVIGGEAQGGRVMFNEGRIVDADSAGSSGEDGFRHIVEITSGAFEFQKSDEGFPIKIVASSNTNLILDTLRRLDEEKH